MEMHRDSPRSANSARLKRGPFLTPIWLSVLGVLLMLGFLGLEAWVWVTADSTMIIVVRHAEKVSGDSRDPPLAPAGEARAALLAGMFGNAREPGHIEAIYVTDTVRNRMTAAPLAASLGLTPSVVSMKDAGGFARRIIREHEGGRVLVVGHADTMPALVASLTGAKNLPPIADDEYGTMYIVTVPRIGRADFLRITY
jgi:broad specificity phosphatase PhoE